MKTFHTSNQLRIVGKAYEVRWQLRKMMEMADEPHEPLAKCLSMRRLTEREPKRNNLVAFPGRRPS